MSVIDYKRYIGSEPISTRNPTGKLCKKSRGATPLIPRDLLDAIGGIQPDEMEEVQRAVSTLILGIMERARGGVKNRRDFKDMYIPAREWIESVVRNDKNAHIITRYIGIGRGRRLPYPERVISAVARVSTIIQCEREKLLAALVKQTKLRNFMGESRGQIVKGTEELPEKPLRYERETDEKHAVKLASLIDPALAKDCALLISGAIPEILECLQEMMGVLQNPYAPNISDMYVQKIAWLWKLLTDAGMTDDGLQNLMEFVCIERIEVPELLIEPCARLERNIAILSQILRHRTEDSAESDTPLTYKPDIAPGRR